MLVFQAQPQQPQTTHQPYIHHSARETDYDIASYLPESIADESYVKDSLIVLPSMQLQQHLLQDSVNGTGGQENHPR